MKNTGYLYLILSTTLFGLFGILTRYVNGSFDPFFLTSLREGVSVLIIFIFLAFGLFKWTKLLREDYRPFIFLGIIASIASVFSYYAFSLLPIAVASFTIFTSNTLLSLVFGKVFLREKTEKITVIALIISLLGILIMYGFTLKNINIFGIFSAFCLALGITASGYLSKKLKGQYHGYQIYLYPSIVVFVVNGFLALILDRPQPTLTLDVAWLWLAIFALVSTIGNGLFYVGLRKKIDLTVVGIIMPFQNVVTLLTGAFFLSEAISLNSAIGGVLIMIAAILPGIKGYIKR